MKPFHLVIENNIQSTDVGVTFYGEDGATPLGSTNCKRKDDPIARLSPDLLIDLEPILNEIEAGIITSAEQLSETDDLLQLRDLLLEKDFNELCTMIFNVLKQVVEKSSSRGTTRSSETKDMAPATSESRWVDPDKRLVRVWFATNRLPIKINDVDQDFDTAESPMR